MYIDNSRLSEGVQVAVRVVLIAVYLPGVRHQDPPKRSSVRNQRRM